MRHQGAGTRRKLPGLATGRTDHDAARRGRAHRVINPGRAAAGDDLVPGGDQGADTRRHASGRDGPGADDADQGHLRPQPFR